MTTKTENCVCDVKVLHNRFKTSYAAKSELQRKLDRGVLLEDRMNYEIVYTSGTGWQIAESYKECVACIVKAFNAESE